MYCFRNRFGAKIIGASLEFGLGHQSSEKDPKGIGKKINEMIFFILIALKKKINFLQVWFS
tara:strand:- start:81 stop:263 length:183 start_codon:yes stop_codon:yes gene_type:complete